MSSPTVLEIVCAHSPDSDDAFMFYGLATKKVRSRLVSFRHVLDDIESLNRKATEGLYELTAISYHAYPYVSSKYVLMASGSSVGDGYGPIVVSSRRLLPEELKGKRIAIPGTLTTAFLALKLFEPDFEHVAIPFDKILDAVKDHEVDAGLVIHEGQLTYGHGGLHNVIDLGKWFRSTYQLPLPLGANALRRDLAPNIREECCRLMRESIQYSLEHREQALNYAMQFARDLEPALAEKFVGMYVNDHTLDGGDVVPRAAQKLLDLGYEAGLIPHKITIEVVR
ncbi:MAG: ABC transporter substrate-binding protein [Acidobacteriaceae bacterium]|nr:ABC transporter substrate-binding protein [Acidobacteriaceae bacterium]MBV9296787.1 ABC transporter substrate-binding protein [Acidobacteriaceae bacterium]